MLSANLQMLIAQMRKLKCANSQITKVCSEFSVEFFKKAVYLRIHTFQPLSSSKQIYSEPKISILDFLKFHKMNSPEPSLPNYPNKV